MRKNAKAGPSTIPGGKKPLPLEKRDPAGIPGISKLKASIRQTKRFLAKDTLEPALRITTERRLVSLEADLANAQRREVEKKNGAKYHQVKFFEKRKLLRIIKRAKKRLEDESTTTTIEAEGGIGAKERKRLEKELKEARIMLNYVRHYPNTQKYIALFPSSSEAGAHDDNDDEESEVGLKLPKLFKKSTTTPASASTKTKKSKDDQWAAERDGDGDGDESTTKRREVLDKIKGMMRAGQLPAEPELVTAATAGPAQHQQVSLADADGKKRGGKKEDKAKEEEADDFFDVDVDGEDEE